MIVDLHTHVWAHLDQLGPEPASRLRARVDAVTGQIDASPAAHEQAMGCVGGAVVLGFRADRIEARIPNELVADFVARQPRRLVGVAGVDPTADDAFDALEAAVSLGLAGVCVSPVCQGFHPAHSRATRLYERCAELGLPLFVTTEEPLTADAELQFARPAGWDEVARALPALSIVIAQLGHPFIDETLVLLGKHERVYADISGVASRPWQLYNALLSAASLGVMDKLLFGSGFPHDTPARTIEALYSVNACGQGTPLPSVPRSAVRAIIERDSLAMLGIDSEVSRPVRGADQGMEVPVVDVLQPPRARAAARPGGQGNGR